MMRCRRCEAIGFGVATGLAVLLIGAGWWLQVPEPGGGGSGGQTVAVALAMFKADAAPAKEAGVAQPEDSESIREVPERIVRTQQPESVPKPEQQKPEPQPTATSTPAPEPVAEQTPTTTTKPQPARPAPPQSLSRREPQQARRPEPAPEPERAVRPDSRAMQGSLEQRVARADTKPSRSPAAGSRAAEKVGGSGLDPSYKAALRAAIEANKRYPRYARMRRQEGEITVAFTVHADGRISDVHIVGEPLSRSLERAAREAVTRVGRFRPLPDNAPSKPMRLRIAVRFDLG